MSRTPATFKQGDVERAVRAAQKVGMKVGGFEVDRSGTIRVLDVCVVGSPSPSSKYDEWKANQ